MHRLRQAVLIGGGGVFVVVAYRAIRKNQPTALGPTLSQSGIPAVTPGGFGSGVSGSQAVRVIGGSFWDHNVPMVWLGPPPPGPGLPPTPPHGHGGGGGGPPGPVGQ